VSGKTVIPFPGKFQSGPRARAGATFGGEPGSGAFFAATLALAQIGKKKRTKLEKILSNNSDLPSGIAGPEGGDMFEDVTSQSNAQRLIIADDHVLFSDALASLIRNKWPSWIVDHVPSLMDLRSHLKAGNRYDIILLDLRMPGMSGPQSIAPVLEFSGETKVILMSGLATASEINAAFNEGVAGFIPKSESGENFLLALKQLIDAEPGQPLRSAPNEMDAGQLSKLSPRELDTARFMAQGLSNKEIAKELGISPATVKVYSKSIIMKFGVRNRTEFAGEAIRLGLV
jgi:two-component system, NarL family, nitrate/nitrite response regulator NarL